MSFKGVNLSPFLFALYINYLEEYLQRHDVDHLHFCDDYNAANYLKLLLMMYADDTVIMSDTEQGLKSAIKALESYCRKWDLTVNTSKTEVVIFSKKKVKKDNFNFVKLFNGTNFQISDTFKYLGVVFAANGSFSKCKKYLYDQANKAMFSLIKKARYLDLPIHMQLDLFDVSVLPVILYGCEIWGFENTDIVEKLQRKFSKFILVLKNSTPTCILYGEL